MRLQQELILIWILAGFILSVFFYAFLERIFQSETNLLSALQ